MTQRPSSLPIPDQYQPLASSGLDVSAQDLAYLYAAYANDKKNGTSEASNFKDALRPHRLVDEIYKSSAYMTLTARACDCAVQQMRRGEL